MSSPDQLGGGVPGPDETQAPYMWPTADPEAVRAAEEEAAGWQAYIEAGGALADLVDQPTQPEEPGFREEVGPLEDVDPVTLAATAEYLANKPTAPVMQRIRERREVKERREAEEAAAEAERVLRYNLGLAPDAPLPPVNLQDDDGSIAFKGKYPGRTGLSRGNDRRVFAAEGLNPDGTEPELPEIKQPVEDDAIAA